MSVLIMGQMVVTIFALAICTTLFSRCIAKAIFLKTMGFFARTARSYLMSPVRLSSLRSFRLKRYQIVLVFMRVSTVTNKIGAIHSLTYIRTHTLLMRRFAIRMDVSLFSRLPQLYFLVFQFYTVWTAVIFNTAFMNFVKAGAEMPKTIIIIAETFMSKKSAVALVALQDRFF